MRSYPYLIVVLALAACGAEGAPAGTPPASVRERLETQATRLLMSSADSAGTVTASLRGHEGWQAGLVDLSVSDGELVVSADASGAITIERFGIGLAPIAIPESVFNNPAELRDTRVTLREPVVVAMPTWAADDDAADATAKLALELTWAISIDGSTIPLGSPDLPPVAVELALSGSGEVVQGELRLAQQGELWSWADIVKLENLSLVLSASTLGVP
jgi:hypothetical protein